MKQLIKQILREQNKFQGASKAEAIMKMYGGRHEFGGSIFEITSVDALSLLPGVVLITYHIINGDGKIGNWFTRKKREITTFFNLKEVFFNTAVNPSLTIGPKLSTILRASVCYYITDQVTDGCGFGDCGSTILADALHLYLDAPIYTLYNAKGDELVADFLVNRFGDKYLTYHGLQTLGNLIKDVYSIQRGGSYDIAPFSSKFKLDSPRSELASRQLAEYFKFCGL